MEVLRKLHEDDVGESDDVQGTHLFERREEWVKPFPVEVVLVFGVFAKVVGVNDDVVHMNKNFKVAYII